MKNNKGDALVTVIMTVVVILLILVIAFFIYEFFLFSNMDKQVASENFTNGINVEVNKIENSIQENNSLENIVETNNNFDNNVKVNNVINNLQENTIQQNVIEENTEEEEIVPIFNEVTSPIIEETTTTNKNKSNIISSTYFYNQLDEYGKIFYDKIEANESKLITGTYVFDFDTKFNTLLHQQNGQEKLGKAFQSAWNAFYYDNSELFYLDISKMTLTRTAETIGGITTYYITMGPGDYTNYLKDEFQTRQQIQEGIKYIDNIVTQIVEQTKQKTDKEKAQLIHDWLINVVEYEQSEIDLNRHDIYGTLYKKKAVCEGYARAYKYLMEQVGVPCVLVSGTGTNSEGMEESHAWNYVQINHKWYAVDVTWDDPIIIGEGTVDSSIKRKYFLRGSDTFFSNHVEEGTISENSMKFKFPTLSEFWYLE